MKTLPLEQAQGTLKEQDVDAQMRKQARDAVQKKKEAEEEEFRAGMKRPRDKVKEDVASVSGNGSAHGESPEKKQRRIPKKAETTKAEATTTGERSHHVPGRKRAKTPLFEHLNMRPDHNSTSEGVFLLSIPAASSSSSSSSSYSAAATDDVGLDPAEAAFKAKIAGWLHDPAAPVSMRVANRAAAVPAAPLDIDPMEAAFKQKIASWLRDGYTPPPASSFQQQQQHQQQRQYQQPRHPRQSTPPLYGPRVAIRAYSPPPRDCDRDAHFWLSAR